MPRACGEGTSTPVHGILRNMENGQALAALALVVAVVLLASSTLGDSGDWTREVGRWRQSGSQASPGTWTQLRQESSRPSAVERGFWLACLCALASTALRYSRLGNLSPRAIVTRSGTVVWANSAAVSLGVVVGERPAGLDAAKRRCVLRLGRRTLASTIVGSELLLVDVTDTIDVERAAFNQFVHEVHNMLAPAQAALELAERLAANKSDQADDIARSLRNLQPSFRVGVSLLDEASHVVRTRLQLRKIFAGNYASAPNVQVVDLESIMSARLDAAAAHAAEGVDLAPSLPPEFDDTDVFVRLDLYIWSHVVRNLLSNATKHTAAGTVTLGFVASREGANGARLLEFAVADTGHGIPDDVKDRLFEEEVAGGDTRSAGLGLLSCRMFCRAIGGSVWLKSTRTLESAEENLSRHGTEFRFCIPGTIVKVERSGSRESIRRPPSSLEVSSSPRIAPRTSPVPSYIPTTPATLPPESLWHVRAVFVVEDSPLVRSTIRCKLMQCVKSLGAPEDHWTFSEHDTVESLLPLVHTLAHRHDVLVTVDENLDSRGGRLRGSDLIKILVSQRFQGLILSVSGSEGLHHLKLGAEVNLGKPLPSANAILFALQAARANKFKSLQARSLSYSRVLSCPNFDPLQTSTHDDNPCSRSLDGALLRRAFKPT